MDDNSLETLTEFEELKCSRCLNHLSVAPILTLGNDKIICGRCKTFVLEENSNPKMERQLVYEKIAKKMKFSCRYEADGCEATLEWNDVEEHERQCDFGKIDCFLSGKKFEENEDCEWKGDSREYFKHINEKHAKKYVKIDKLNIWDDPKNRLLKINYFNDALLVFLIYNDDCYHLTLIGENKKQPIKCKIEVMDETGENFIVLTRLATFLPLNFEKIRELGLKLNTNFSNPKFLSIYFEDKFKFIENFGDKSFPKCDVCKDRLTLPVFCCDSLHKYCKKCFENSATKECQINHLKSSRSPFNITPSICKPSLHRDFSSSNYKCENPGCFFLGNFYESENHVEFCKFKTEFVSKLNFFYELSDEISNSSFFFVFDNSTFKLLKSDFANTCTFRLFALKTTQVKYKFDIEVFHLTFPVLSFSIFPTFDLSVNNCYSDNSVEVPKTLLYRFGYDRFKFNISKI